MNKRSKPLLTFALVAYNQERFIREAIEGAFSQTYSPLEIILSDDCSTDSTFKIMEEMANRYRGPHNIVLNRNDKNKGIGAHINRVMELSKGELIIGAAGDDVSLPERVEEIYKAYEHSGQSAMSIHSSLIMIDAEGKERGIIQEFPNGYSMDIETAVRNGTNVWGCTHAWHRQVFDIFGPLMDNVVLEDMAISFRSLLIGKIIHINKPLVRYRLHSGNCYGQISMFDKTVIKFKTSESFYRWRISKLLNSINTYNQYYEDLKNNKVLLDELTRKNIEKKIIKIINELKVEILLKTEIKELGIKNVFLEIGNRPIIKIKAILLLYFPKLFMLLSYYKWRSQKWLQQF